MSAFIFVQEFSLTESDDEIITANNDSELDQAEGYSTLSIHFSPSQTSSNIVKSNNSKLQLQRKAQWNQFATMPTVSCPKGGHTTHLFHHEKIPQFWSPFLC